MDYVSSNLKPSYLTAYKSDCVFVELNQTIMKFECIIAIFTFNIAPGGPWGPSGIFKLPEKTNDVTRDSKKNIFPSIVLYCIELSN